MDAGDELGAVGGRDAPQASHSGRENEGQSRATDAKRREGLFTREEYRRCSEGKEKPLRGITLMPMKELNEFSMNWPSDRIISSKNLLFLRGLAVTFFYQSQMSQARQILLRVYERFEDLDTVLMLAECICALPDIKSDKGEKFWVAVSRVCKFVKTCSYVTSRLIDEWNEKMMKCGRFMGYVVLQYAWYRRHKEYKVDQNTSHLLYAVIKKLVLQLYKVRDKLTNSYVNQAFFLLLVKLKDDVDGLSNVAIRKQAYVKALCCNALAWILIQRGSFDAGKKFVEDGIRAMDQGYGREKIERILYGDLYLNKGVAQYKQLPGYNNDHEPSFRKALNVYRNSAREDITEGTRQGLIKLVQNNFDKAVVFRR